MNDHGRLRIAIVGAGPAGLSLAWFLRRLGMESVEIFEASDRIGGQSHTIDVDGIPVELGTCYLADGYVIAREIADAAGCPAERLPPATFINAQGDIYKPTAPPNLRVLKYVWKWLIWYLRGQLWKPTLPGYWGRFDKWLEDQGLDDLENSMIFSDGCNAQLYGPLRDISANSGLSWVRPSLLYTGRVEDTASIPAGFENMWKGLVDHLGYKVNLRTPIDHVQPVSTAAGDGVQLLRDGEPIDEAFDHVFVACPLDEVGDKSDFRLQHPLSEALRNRFAPFEATEVYSAVWKALDWPAAAPSRCYLPNAQESAKRGGLLTIRKFGRVGEQWVGQLCSYALENHPGHEHERREANRERVMEDMRDLLKMRDIEIVQDQVVRYSIRFSQEQYEQGLPGYIASRQGEGNIWYTGGTLSHWDVDMIANFNQSLAWRFGKTIGLSFFQRLQIFKLRDLFRSL